MVKEIALRNEKSAVGPKNMRGAKNGLRGVYYLSPFIRDLQNCQELLDLYEDLIGERVIPHCCFSNVPQVKLGFLLGYFSSKCVIL